MYSTSVWFLYLNVIFQRAFSSFAGMGDEMILFMPVAALPVWLVLMLLSRRGLRTDLAFSVASVSLGVSMALQIAVIGLGALDIVAWDSLLALAVATSVIFTLGYAFYLGLWVRVFEERTPGQFIVLAGIGCIGGICVSDLSVLAFSGQGWGWAACSVVRVALVSVSLVCLRCELRACVAGGRLGGEALPVSGARGFFPSLGRSVASGRSPVRIVVAVAACFVVLNFVMNSSSGRDAESSTVGVWTLPLISFVTMGVVMLAAMSREERGAPLSGPVFGYLSIVAALLYLVYVSVTGGMADRMWMAIYAANCLLDFAVVGVFAWLGHTEGTAGGGAWGALCATYFLKEAASVAGCAVDRFVDPAAVLVFDLALVFALIVFAAWLMFGPAVGSDSASGSDAEPSSRARRFAREYAARVGCTPREEEVLFYLAQGSSYTRIAKKMFLAESTVKTHANHVYAKLGLNSRDELIDLFYEEGDGFKSPGTSA